MVQVQAAKFGTLLRKYRAAAGLTQEELAERSGVSPRSISDIERDVSRVPHRGTVDRLADALQLGEDERAAFETAARRDISTHIATDGNHFHNGRSSGSLLRTLLSRLRTSYLLGVPSKLQQRRVVLIGGACLTLAALTLLLAVVNARTSLIPVQTHSSVFTAWGWNYTGPRQLNAPSAVAVDAQGVVYIADTGNDRIEKLSPVGSVLASWGTAGKAPGQFIRPQSVAVSSTGLIFVVDAGNARVQELSPTGLPLAEWGATFGYRKPASIVINGRDHVFLLDAGWNCAGLFLSSPFNGWCGNSHPDFPITALTADARDHLYVASSASDRLVELSPVGDVLTDRHIPMSRGSGAVRPAGLALGPHGNLYVVDGSGSQIRIIAPSGALLATWSLTRSPGQVLDPSGVSVDAKGNVYVAEPGADSVEKFSPAGKLLATWNRLNPAPLRVDSPHTLARDQHGNVYVLTGSSANHLLKFSADGSLLSDWGPNTFKKTGAYSLNGLAVDTRGSIYVSDVLDGTVEKLSAAGRVVGQFGHDGTVAGDFSVPRGVAVDGRGNIYVADSGNNRIQKLSPRGSFISEVTYFGPNKGQRNAPRDVAIGAHGDMYVVDMANRVVQMLSADGRYVAHWGPGGVGADDQFVDPTRVAVDRQGIVYVQDGGAGNVLEFSPQGRLLAHFGTKGHRPGQLSAPDGIVLGRGAMYVADTGNNRIQRLLLGR